MNESIGGKLRLARERRRLTLEQVSEATRVRAHYLQALESDDVSGMPSSAQARGFLRIYADFLGLAVDQLIPPAPAEPIVAAPTSAAEGEAKQVAPKGTPGAFFARLRSRLAPSAAKEPDEIVPVEVNEPAPQITKPVKMETVTEPPSAPAAIAPAAEIPPEPKKKDRA